MFFALKYLLQSNVRVPKEKFPLMRKWAFVPDIPSAYWRLTTVVLAESAGIQRHSSQSVTGPRIELVYRESLLTSGR